jgi:hypothetical protein
MLSSLAAADRATDSSFAGTPIARIQVCGRQAKAPARLIEGGTVTTALVGQIAVAKYGRHFDFYRQMQIATASNSNRHSPDEIWNGVDDSRRRGSPEGTDQLRSAPPAFRSPHRRPSMSELVRKGQRSRYREGPLWVDFCRSPAARTTINYRPSRSACELTIYVFSGNKTHSLYFARRAFCIAANTIKSE